MTTDTDRELSTKTDLSVVIPVFNEETCLSELYRRLTDVMAATVRRYEIIFVDDGSCDGSLALIKQFHARDPHVRYLSFARNFGQTMAISAGQASSRGDAVITLDCDLQNPPEEIPRLLAKSDEGYEVVYGVRRNRRDPLLRRAGSKVMTGLLRRCLPASVRLNLTAFSVVHRRVIDELNRCPERIRFQPALCAWLGARTAHVNVRHEKRLHGKTKYNLRRLVRIAIDLLTSYSRMPLQLASWVGALILTGGVGLGCWAAIDKLTVGSTEGWAVITSAIGVVGGLQLLAIGVLGEYVSRMYAQLLGRPQYVIRETEPTAAAGAIRNRPRRDAGVSTSDTARNIRSTSASSLVQAEPEAT